MTEFRTSPPGGEQQENNADNSGGLESILNEAINNIKETPELQMQLAQVMQQQGINPQLLQAVAPDMELPEGEVPSAEVDNSPSNPVNSSPSGIPETDGGQIEAPKPEEISGLLDDIIEYTGEDWTLGELQDFAQQNPDVLETAISMRFE